MKIAITAVSSAAHLSGVSRHAANLVRCLLTRTEISAVHLIVAPWQHRALLGALPGGDARLQIHSVSVGSSAFSRNLWYYLRLPILARELKVDLLHLAYPVPLNRHAFHCSTVVTLHDLYPYDIPANFGFPKVLFNRLILQQCLRSVDAIACVSESTRHQLDIYAPRLELQKAVTIYNCVEPDSSTTLQSPLPKWNGEPFLLCVAQHRRNKNILLALQVFHRLLRDGDIASEALLVIVGIEGPETARIHRFIRTLGLTNQVVFLHGITDAGLQWCYEHCELLLAPSTIEGFGLPIVEAMFHHCDIVCSDIPAFREVGGTYCHYAKLQPAAEEAFVQAIKRARSSTNPHVPSVDHFSSPHIANAYLQLYTRLRNGCFANGACSHCHLAPLLEREGDYERLNK
jgi:glycosyltransferase involved in cell wall biosynthesis